VTLGVKRLALLIAKAGGGEFSTDPAQAHALARLRACPVQTLGHCDGVSKRLAGLFDRETRLIVDSSLLELFIEGLRPFERSRLR
jgi:hypothetical protein